MKRVGCLLALWMVVAGCTRANEDRVDPGAGGSGGSGGMAGSGGGDAGGSASGGMGGSGGGALADAGPGGGECADGATENRACGPNGRGTEVRACADGRWTAWGDCQDQDECVIGARDEQPCDGGVHERACDDGRWSDFGPCTPPAACEAGQTDQAACGPNGRGQQTRSCQDGGTWGPWGDCQGDGECVDGRMETQACGPDGRGQQTRTCARGAWGDWGDCQGAGVCADGATQSMPCGPNGDGTQTRTCVQGQWGDWGDCQGGGACANGASESQTCGLNGRGMQSRTCADGRWGAYGACADPDVCVDGRPDAQACGLNGRGMQSRTCANGQWGAYGACADPDVCADGATQQRDCDQSGVQARSCDAGQWSDYGPCQDPDDPCVSPVASLDLAPGHQELQVETSGESWYEGDCAGGGPEVTAQIQVDAPMDVTFTVTEAAFDTVLYLRGTCDDVNTEIACNDDRAHGDTRSEIQAHLGPGTYFLVVDGYGAQDAGTATVGIDAAAGGCNDGDVENQDCPGGTNIRRCVGGAWTDWSGCILDRCDPAIPACQECTDQLEPDDALEEAVAIDPGESYGGLTLCTALDSDDWFAFPVDQPSLVTVSTHQEVDGGFAGGWDVSVEGVDGPLTGINQVSADAVARVVFVDEPGTWFARVSAARLAGTLHYALQADVEPGPACEWTDDADGCVACRDDRDPNDDRAHARAVHLGDTIDGLGVCSGLDAQDWFAFDVPQRTQVTVQITADVTVGRASLFWEDNGGNLVVNQGHADGDRQWLTATVNRGHYFVEVRADPGVVGYQLSISSN
jgi:hypothetical protein